MTKDDYLAGIDYLAKKQPDHPLLPSICRGYSLMNVKYLERALKDVPPPASIEQKKAIKNKAGDPIINKLNGLLNKAFGKRAKLSNSFHSCKTDGDRYKVSMKIQEVQADIEKFMSQKTFYIEKGRLPPKDDKYPIPDAPLEIVKLRNSLQSRISQLKAELKKLHQKHGTAERKKAVEALLADKKIYLGYVRQAYKEI